MELKITITLDEEFDEDKLEINYDWWLVPQQNFEKKKERYFIIEHINHDTNTTR